MMNNIETLKKIFEGTDKAVIITDEKMQPVWCSQGSRYADFSADKLDLFEKKPLQLPLTSTTVAQYKSMFGESCAVEIQPIEQGTQGYLIRVFSCDDIEMLSDRSGHLKFKINYLGNIRNELSQIVFKLDALRQKYVEAGDLDFLNLDKEAKYRIVRTLSATVNLNELTKYYNGCYSRETVCISDVLTDLGEEVTELFERENDALICKIDQLVYLRTNADRLRAAVCNLLVNAHMYNTAAKKKCCLKLTKQDSDIIISVENNGGVADASQLENFTQPFEAFREYGEHESLGIAVAAKYCESLGGKLTFTGKKGKSTKVTMTLPSNCAAVPADFKIDHVPPMANPYGLQSCILAKGVNIIK